MLSHLLSTLNRDVRVGNVWLYDRLSLRLSFDYRVVYLHYLSHQPMYPGRASMETRALLLHYWTVKDSEPGIYNRRMYGRYRNQILNIGYCRVYHGEN